ncbi:MAG: metalloregulator ArsR/SmtB family transcription factor [Proteobacteria bacterium]|nr:metalloregulator ArsR/SmtB family transcription factor [Pseudomonadota bacterium]MBU1688887.1 metalloregulator ArsR/SmtB family transcription factor [Pseudomonadota bacterium]
MKTTIQQLKALTDETRLRLLALLAHGELYISDLVAVLRLPQSTVSRHLVLLKNGGWITDRRQGLWMYYQLTPAENSLPAELQNILLARLGTIIEIKKDQGLLEIHLKGNWLNL